jgi:hypothetical protein
MQTVGYHAYRSKRISQSSTYCLLKHGIDTPLVDLPHITFQIRVLKLYGLECPVSDKLITAQQIMRALVRSMSLVQLTLDGSSEYKGRKSTALYKLGREASRKVLETREEAYSALGSTNRSNIEDKISKGKVFIRVRVEE